ncbi:MAG TPA: hypothetical protein VFH45_10410, partial [Acidimicrobiales bacterium]|nr:hypothetical protein [Acidimicrobiales bacterium]
MTRRPIGRDEAEALASGRVGADDVAPELRPLARLVGAARLPADGGVPGADPPHDLLAAMSAAVWREDLAVAGSRRTPRIKARPLGVRITAGAAIAGAGLFGSLTAASAMSGAVARAVHDVIGVDLPFAATRPPAAPASGRGTSNGNTPGGPSTTQAGQGSGRSVTASHHGQTGGPGGATVTDTTGTSEPCPAPLTPSASTSASDRPASGDHGNHGDHGGSKATVCTDSGQGAANSGGQENVGTTTVDQGDGNGGGSGNGGNGDRGSGDGSHSNGGHGQVGGGTGGGDNGASGGSGSGGHGNAGASGQSGSNGGSNSSGSGGHGAKGGGSGGNGKSSDHNSGAAGTGKSGNGASGQSGATGSGSGSGNQGGSAGNTGTGGFG